MESENEDEDLNDGESEIEDLEAEAIIDEVEDLERTIREEHGGNVVSSDGEPWGAAPSNPTGLRSNLRPQLRKRNRRVITSSGSSSSDDHRPPRQRSRLESPPVLWTSSDPPPGVAVDEFGLPLPTSPVSAQPESRQRQSSILTPPPRTPSRPQVPEDDSSYIVLAPPLQLRGQPEHVEGSSEAVERDTRPGDQDFEIHSLLILIT